MRPIDRLRALRDELLDLTKARTSDGKPTHIPPPKSANGQAKARAEGYAPTPSGKTWAHSSVRRRNESSPRRAAPRSPGGDLLKKTTPLMLLRDHGSEKMAEMLSGFSKADLVRYARREGIPLPGRLTGPKGTAEAVVVALVEAAQFQKDDLAADRRDEIDAKQREWSASLATRHKSAEHVAQAMVDAVDTLSDHIVEGMRGDPQAVQTVMRRMQATVTRGGAAPEGAVTPDEMVRDVLGAILAHARKSPELARKVSELMKRPVHIEGSAATGGKRAASPVVLAAQHTDEELHAFYRDASSKDLRAVMRTHHLATAVDMQGLGTDDLRKLLVQRARKRYTDHAA